LPIPSERIAALEKQGHDHFAERSSKAQPVAWSQMILGRDLRAWRRLQAAIARTSR
jgi:hypothetical protein